MDIKNEFLVAFNFNGLMLSFWNVWFCLYGDFIVLDSSVLWGKYLYGYIVLGQVILYAYLR